MIDNYKEDKDFYGPIQEEYITLVEDELKVSFPDQYKEFVRNYGSGGICGVNVLGIEGELGSSVLLNTKRYRQLGLPKDLIVIEDLGEFVVCSKTGSKTSVLYWNRFQKQGTVMYENFYEYLFDTFKEAIDNW